MACTHPVERGLAAFQRGGKSIGGEAFGADPRRQCEFNGLLKNRGTFLQTTTLPYTDKVTLSSPSEEDQLEVMP